MDNKGPVWIEARPVVDADGNVDDLITQFDTSMATFLGSHVKTKKTPPQVSSYASVITERARKTSEDEFFENLKLGKISTRTYRRRFQHETDVDTGFPELSPLPPQTLPNENTETQGGVLGSMKGLTSAANPIMEKLREWRDAIYERLHKMGKWLLANRFLGPVFGVLLDLMRAFKTVFSYIFDIAWQLGPVQIYHLWQSRRNKWELIASALAAIYDINKAEELYGDKFVLDVVANGGLVGFDPSEKDYGPLTTNIRSVCKEINRLHAEKKLDRKSFEDEVKRLGFFCSFNFNYEAYSVSRGPSFNPAKFTPKVAADKKEKLHPFLKTADKVTGSAKAFYAKYFASKVEAKEDDKTDEIVDTDEEVGSLVQEDTESESGFGDIMTTIWNSACIFIRKLPKHLQTAGTFLTDLFKTYMPLILGVATLPRTVNAVSDAIKAVWTWIFGTTSDPKAWLQYEITREDSPVHKLVVAYTAYQTAIFEKLPGTRTIDLRTDYYKARVAADEYATSSGKLCQEWYAFTSHLERNMATPPKIVPRKNEPTTLYLFGSPGTGKSSFWPLIVGEAICPGAESAKDPIAEITGQTYVYQGASEFQVGMSTAKIVLFDDFGQDRSSAKENEEIMLFMTMCTRAPMQVNSPNITGVEVKGCPVEPDAIVILTNIELDVAAAKIADKEAPHRRVDVGFKITENIDIDDLDKKCLQVTHCARYKKAIGTVMSVNEARALYTTVHMNKTASFRSLTDSVNENLKMRKAFANLHLRKEDDKKVSPPAWQQDKEVSEEWEYARLCALHGLRRRFDLDNIVSIKTLKAFFRKMNLSQEEIDRICAPENMLAINARDMKHFYLSTDFKKSLEEAGFQITKPEIGDKSWHAISSAIATGALVGLPIAAAVVVADTIGSVLSEHILGYSRLAGISGWIKKIITAFVKGATAVGLALLAWKVLMRDPADESGGNKTSKAKDRQVAVATATQSGKMMEMDQIDDLIQRATGTIWREDTNAGVNVLFIGGHYILLPMHFVHDFNKNEPLAEGTKLKITKYSWVNLARGFTFHRGSLRPLGGNLYKGIALDSLKFPVRDDVVLYELPSNVFNAEKNIVHHFWNGDFDPTGLLISKTDYIYQLDGQGTMNTLFGRVTKDRVTTVRGDGIGVPTVFHIVAQYDIPGRPSSCGSAIRLRQQEHPILGIHVAANSSSYFHYVTRSSLEHAMKNVLELPELSTDIELGVRGESYFPVPSCLELVGQNHVTVFTPTKTELQKSEAHGCFGTPKTEPAVLHYRDTRMSSEFRTPERFYAELFKHNVPAYDVGINENYFMALDSMREWMRHLTRTSEIPLRVLTPEETLNGAHWKDSTKIDLSTSPGFPYSQQGLTRRDLIKQDADGKLSFGDQLQLDFKTACFNIERGKIPFLPFSITLKDEKVKIKKITTPATRLFFNGNLVHLLICRKYFHARLMQMYHYQYGMGAFCMPSLDRLSLDWHELTLYMLEASDHGFDFDFSRWDRHISKRMISDCVDLMLTDLPISLVEQQVLKEMISGPYMLWKDKIYRTSGTQVSGILITYALNCVLNELIHRTAFYETLKAKPQLRNIGIYYRYVRGMRCGDDTITTMDPRLEPYFNGITVARIFERMGFEVTSSDKESQIVPSKHYMKMGFLKNKTHYSEGHFLPLTDEDSLYETMYWIRLTGDNHDRLKATEDNVMAALRGFFFYGRTKYERVRSKLLEFCPRLVLPTYQEIDFIWTEYYRLPGNADYAARETIEDPFEMTLQPHRIKIAENARQQEKNDTMYTLPTHTTVPQLGEDKAAEGNTTPNAPLTAVHHTTQDEKHDPKTLGDPASTETERVGTTLQDGAQVSIKTITVGNKQIDAYSQRAAAYLNDSNWDLSMLEEKFTLVKTADWKISDTVGTQLMSLVLPNDILVTPAQRTPFDVTKLYRFAQIRLKLIVKSSPFYQGCLVFGFSPYGDIPEVGRQIQMGAVIHKLSGDEGSELVVPFRHHKGFLDITKDNIGTAMIAVLNPLKTGTGNVTSISVALYAAVEDAEFKIPDPVPSKYAYSRKFDNEYTMVESSILEGGAKPIIVDINQPIRQMPLTKMCAGIGSLVPVEQEHFQCSETDLVLPHKRFRGISYFEVNLPKTTSVLLGADYNDLVLVAAGALPNYFKLFRGSIDVRVRAYVKNEYNQTLDPSTIRLSLSMAMNGSAPVTTPLGRLDGTSDFLMNEEGSITIPYLDRTYTSPYGEAEPKSLILEIFNHLGQDFVIGIEVSASVGDDFSTGLFRGSPDHALTKKLVAF